MDTYWITWFPGAFLAMLGILALCYKGIRAFIKITDAVPLVYQIHHEFSPNSGTSMADKVNNLTSDVQALNTKVQDGNGIMRQHIEADRQAFGRQERTNTRVERTLDRIERQVGQT